MKQSKKRIVLGVCGGLLSLWLLFLLGFSGWQIAAQREKDLNDIAALLDAGDETVGGVWETQLQRDYSASAVDIDAAVSANAFATSYLNQMAAGQEMALALYSPKPELITYNKPELMLQVEIPYKHLPSSVFDIFYCSMNPFDYMDEDSAKTLMEYASYESPMTNGCVSSYSIMVSMWTDGAQIVPRSIYVLPRWYLCGDDWAWELLAPSMDSVTVQEQEDGSILITANGGRGVGSATAGPDQRSVRQKGGWAEPYIGETGELVWEDGDSIEPVWEYHAPSDEAADGMIITTGRVHTTAFSALWLYQIGMYRVFFEGADLYSAFASQEREVYLEEVRDEERMRQYAKTGWTLPDTEEIGRGTTGFLTASGFFRTQYYILWQIPSWNHETESSTKAAPADSPLRDSLKAIGLTAAGSLLLFCIVGAVLVWQLFGIYDRERAMEAQRRRTTNAIAHDLKTPMAAIMGYSENLLEHTRPDMEEHFLKSMHTQVERMNGIVTEMLELSRLEAGADTLHMELISLKPLCEKAAEAYQDAGRLFLLEGDAEIQGDRQMLLRVMDNFLSNAVRHTKDGETIRISITENRCSVYNPGDPIPEEAMQKLWEAYYQADESRSAGGSGLGLSIAREVLERHGFSYGAENVDDGVSFWFQHAP